jgi:hypothetical protein
MMHTIVSYGRFWQVLQYPQAAVAGQGRADTWTWDLLSPSVLCVKQGISSA